MDPILPTHESHRLRRIVLTGSESVGKSSLAVLLAQHFDCLVVPEFVRQYAASKGAPLDFRDHGPIARGQIAAEDTAIAQAMARDDIVLVHDTDLVSTVVYCHHYFGRCPDFIEELAVARRATHYLLLDIDVPWVPDGIRDRGDRRAELHSLFSSTLTRFACDYTLIRGDWSTRLAHAVQVVTDRAAPPLHTTDPS